MGNLDTFKQISSLMTSMLQSDERIVLLFLDYGNLESRMNVYSSGNIPWREPARRTGRLADRDRRSNQALDGNPGGNVCSSSLRVRVKGQEQMCRLKIWPQFEADTVRKAG